MNDGASTPGRAPALVGRHAELARVDAFVEALRETPRALLVRGELGIGKSALWRAAIARCRAAGFRVLITRPAEEEMALDLVGLVDLFEDGGLDLPGLRAEDDAFARGRAVFGALRALAESSPTVVAVDDVQWLDSVSAQALRYALRRLEAERIGLLVTVRHGAGPTDPTAAVMVFPPERHEVLDLGPLGLEDLRQVLGGTVASISRPTLRRIHEVSGGNPLYAIELARGLELEEDSGSRAGLPLPDSLQAAIARRLERVPPELTPLLETASALGTTSVKVLREVLPHTEIDGLLTVAEERGLVIVEDDLEVRLSHPLVGSGVYARMNPLARRSLHTRLADLAADPDVRARHLALSTDEPDADVARLLEEAAERAGARGATDLAAEFARHSVRLTPATEEDAARRRAIFEIVHRAAAGEASRALALIDQLVAALPPGPARAEALLQRFYVGADDLQWADSLLVRALEEAGEEELLRGRVMDILGWLRGMFRGDLRAGIECAQEAVAIADRHRDAELQMLAASHLGHMEALAGHPRPDRMARAVALAEEIGRPRLGGGPRAWSAKQLLWAGDLPAARALLESVLADDVRSGNELERPYRLYDLALVELGAGELVSAEEIVRRGIEAARDAENADAEGWLFYPLALVEAWLGRPERAREAAHGLSEWGRRRGGLPGMVRARGALGTLALSEGDDRAAARELVEGARLLEEWGFAHPGALSIVPDAIEALARSGGIVDAEVLLRRLEAQAAALDHEWTWAVLERSRGVFQLAQGHADDAVTRLESAAVVFDRLGHRPDAARAVLERGRAHRRAGRRSLAAGVLAEARDRFGSMGATMWRARAEEELERAAPGLTAGALTQSEAQVANLASQGLKNREIAQALYVSVATVEAHLTRIYRKLGIRSRSDLARLVADGSLEVGLDAG